MLKKFLYSIAFVSSVLPLYENVQSKQLHALPNYYDGHVTSEQNYRNSIFSKPINSCRFFALQPRFNGTNFELASGSSPLLSFEQYKDLYEEVTFSPIFELLCGWAKRFLSHVRITETRTRTNNIISASGQIISSGPTQIISTSERLPTKAEFIDILRKQISTSIGEAKNLLESYIPLIDQIFSTASSINSEDLTRQAQTLNNLEELLRKYKPQDLTMYEVKDPRLSYFFNYGISDIDTFTESTFQSIFVPKDDHIFYHLMDRTRRKNLMAQCKWSPADILSLIEHDIFVAVNHCAPHLADSLRNVLLDILDDPTTYENVPFSLEKEKKEKERMRQASYLLSEGTFAFRGNPRISVVGDTDSQSQTRGKTAIPFSTNNKLTRSLAQFVNENAEINEAFVAEVGSKIYDVDLFVKLEDMRRHKNNEKITYEKLKNWDSARLKAIERLWIDYPTISGITGLRKENGIVLDCNGGQTRGFKSLSSTCEMNASTQIFLQNNAFPGLFVFEDLKNSKLSQFFANLSKNSGSTPENTRRFRNFSLQQGGFFDNDAWTSTASLFGANFVSVNSRVQGSIRQSPPVYLNIYGPVIFLDNIPNHARWLRMKYAQDTERQRIDRNWRVYKTNTDYDQRMHVQEAHTTYGRSVHTFIPNPDFTGKTTYFDYLHHNKPATRARTSIVKSKK